MRVEGIVWNVHSNIQTKQNLKNILGVHLRLTARNSSSAALLGIRLQAELATLVAGVHSCLLVQPITNRLDVFGCVGRSTYRNQNRTLTKCVSNRAEITAALSKYVNIEEILLA
jgi:hypothetical protein